MSIPMVIPGFLCNEEGDSVSEFTGQNESENLQGRARTGEGHGH